MRQDSLGGRSSPRFSKEALQRARQRISDQGLSVEEWSSRHGFASSYVYNVLSGSKLCLHGVGHKIAVALGLKRDPDAIDLPSAASA